MSRQARSYAYTLNNYTETELKSLEAIPRVKYHVASKEYGDDNKTPHLQGFITFNSPKKFAQVKLLLGNRAHIEVAKKSPLANSRYCKKDGDVAFEVGASPTGAGFRSDLEELHKLIKSGKTVDEVLLEHHSALRCYKGLERLVQAMDAKVRHVQDDIKVYVLWGEAGTGKTRWAHEQYPDLYVVPMWVI